MHVHAEILGLAGVIAHGHQVQAERRVHNAPHHETGNGQQRKAIIIERAGQKLDLVITRKFDTEYVHARHAHATVAACQIVELEKKGMEQHAERERQHTEENAGIAHAQRADRQRDHA